MSAQQRPSRPSARSRSGPPPSGLRKVPGFPGIPLGLVLTLAGVGMLRPLDRSALAASGPIHEVVRSLCLSAFETEVAQSGKKPPDGMASFACDCVAERISSGSSIASARSSCREATVRRHPI